MQIKRISVFQVDLPLHEGSYNWSGGKSVEVFDSTVVAIETDAGITGYGEVCPLGPAYLPAYAEGARAGIAELAPNLIGVDPTQLLEVNRTMDHLMRVMLYRAISQDTPDAMAASIANYREQGYRKFQLKVGGDPQEDINRILAAANVLEAGDVLVADANTGWLAHQAARVVDAVRDVDVYIEQPCLTYEECLTIRRRTDRPFILDEVIDGVQSVVRGYADGAMDVINLKISKVGGLTRARQVRDLCVSLGLPMTIEDTWGGDIITAAIAHLAHSTPTDFVFSATDFNSYVTVSIAEGAPQREHGTLAAPTAPGLGVSPREEVLIDNIMNLKRVNAQHGFHL